MYERYYDYLHRRTGPAFVVDENGEALCAFGALFEWGKSGACEVWFNFIDKRRAFNIVRILKRLITELASKYEITRMQATVSADSERNNRFMAFLGFSNETPGGMKKKLYNGKTAYLYSRCF